MKSSSGANSFEFPSFPLISETQSYVIGDVTIHPQAVIAPGVIIQATTHSQVIIEAGVCIGTGAVIQAYEGKIVVQEGAVVGARVLMIGQCTIGHHSCIGSATTIFNQSVSPMAGIEAYSRLGDSSRCLPEFEESSSPPTPSQAEISDAQSSQPEPQGESRTESKDYDLSSMFPDPFAEDEVSEDIQASEITAKNEDHASSLSSESTVQSSAEIETADEDLPPLEVEPERQPENPETGQDASASTLKTPVVGQVYINNLLVTLFPNRQSISNPSDLE